MNMQILSRQSLSAGSGTASPVSTGSLQFVGISKLWLCFVILVMPFSLLYGASPSDSSAKALSDLQLASQVESIYKGRAQNNTHELTDDGLTPLDRQYSGTSLMKIVDQRWDNFSEDIQKRLVHYIDEPVTTGPGAPDSQEVFETEHFKVFFQTSGESAVPERDDNNNNVPDYAENVASYLETSWEIEVDKFGFRAPPRVNGEKIRCHLKKLNHNGLTHAKTNVAAWMEIHSDIGAYTKGILGEDKAESITVDPEGMEAGLLKACCAHEFLHCCQASYDWNEANWWCEATAEWAGNAVFPESKFYTNNVSPRFDNPHVSLFSKEGWYEYAASIWAMFLYENYGGHETIRSIWEGCTGDTTVNEATTQVLGDLKEPFIFFACYNYIREYADGARYPEIKEISLKDAGEVSSVGLNAPQYFGSNYITVSPAESGITTIEVELSNENDEADVRLITIDGSNWNILPHKLSFGKLVVDLGDSRPEKVVTVICSFTESGELGYTFRAR